MLSETISNRYARVKEIFSAALEFSSAEERRNFLRAACGDSEDLRREVESLLKAREDAAGFLEDVSAARVVHDSINRSDDFVGQMIDKYRVERQIGRGGMGVVFLASREDFHQPVAVKIIKRGMDSDAILERFRREREILAALNHVYIARLIDGGTTRDNLPFFVMEFSPSMKRAASKIRTTPESTIILGRSIAVSPPRSNKTAKSKNPTDTRARRCQSLKICWRKVQRIWVIIAIQPSRIFSAEKFWFAANAPQTRSNTFAARSN